jgi:rubrerythrin
MNILIPLILTANCISFISCNDNDATIAKMKTPTDTSSIQSTGKPVNSAEAKAKTIENIQAAFKGETNAGATYAAFSKKAYETGYHEIALLFKAISISENIHAQNHKIVLEDLSVAVNDVTPDFTVKSTKENLAYAISGEAYEAAEMYPSFLITANAANSELAIVSLNYACKTEIKHKALYEKALTELINNNVKSLPGVYFICPTCGNTYANTASKHCGISMTNGEKFIKINSL